MDRDGNLVVPEFVIRAAVLAALAFLIAGYFHGLFTPAQVKPVPADAVVMTSAQAHLTRQAIGMVRNDAVQGSYSTAGLAIQALSSLLPSDVRDRVLSKLGSPDLDAMPDALTALEGKIVVRN